MKRAKIHIMEEGKKGHAIIEDYFLEIDYRKIVELYPDYQAIENYIRTFMENRISLTDELDGQTIHSLMNFPAFEIKRLRGCVKDSEGDIEDAIKYYKPYRIERRMFDHKMGVHIVADVIFKRKDGTGAILDWKCGASSPDKLDSKYRQQQTLYVWRLNDGHDENGNKLIDILITHFVIVYLGGVEAKHFKEECPKKRSLNAMKKKVEWFRELVAKGIYERNWNDSPYKCKGGGWFTANYQKEQCQFYEQCKQAIKDKIDQEDDLEEIGFVSVSPEELNEVE
jgi:hypothetical protein